MKVGEHIVKPIAKMIAYFTGNRSKSIHSTRDIDELVAAINALRNIKIVRGAYDSVLIGQNGVIIQLAPDSQATQGIDFKGEWKATNAYKVKDVVFIRAGATAGAYICIKAAPGAANVPTNPDTGNLYWMAWPGSFPLGQWG